MDTASSLHLLHPWHAQAFVPWLSEWARKCRSVDSARHLHYTQVAEGVSVCFKGIAGRLRSGCLADITVLVVKQERFLPALSLLHFFFHEEECSFRFEAISGSNKITL